MNGANPESLVGMARAYARGKMLCAAVRLGVADILSEGEAGLDALAAKADSNVDSLGRLMRGLASIGVVKETAPNRFALTSFGAPLSRSAPDSVWASIVFWADLLADAWTYLPDCVRAGGMSGAAEARERDHAPSRWSLEPNATAIFHAVFAEPSVESMAPLAKVLDLSMSRIVADLGGAGGGLLSAILLANPHLQGILVDRQEAVDGATRRFESLGLSGRCRAIVGDLAEAVPAGADVYILKSVLHGCDDAAAGRILGNCRRVMSPKHRLLVIEAVLPERVEKPDTRVEEMFISDLNMLAVTGGRERRASEWKSLLSSAGFDLRRLVLGSKQILTVIEASPLAGD